MESNDRENRPMNAIVVIQASAPPKCSHGRWRGGFLQKGVQAEDEAGGVDAGMAGVGDDPFQVAVDDQAHMMIPVVDQTHRRDRARMNAEVAVHMLRGCERQSCAAQLRRQVFSLEGFVGRHHQQIEIGLLLVGQKEILEYGCSGLFPHSLTFLHGERRRMA